MYCVMPRNFWVAAVCLVSAACGSAQHPASPGAVPPEPDPDRPAVAAEPAPESSAPAPGDSAPAPDNSTDPEKADGGVSSKLLSVTTTMKMDGSIDATALKSELNQQLSSLEPCVALIRKTDQTVGSLNLQVKVDGSGAVSVDLQSPVNPHAKRCLMKGMRTWHVQQAGTGTAMALVQLGDPH